MAPLVFGTRRQLQSARLGGRFRRCGGRSRFLQALQDDGDQRHDQQWKGAVQRVMDHPGELAIATRAPRTAGPRPRNRGFRWPVRVRVPMEIVPQYEQDPGDHEIDGTENGRRRNRAPDLDQREIGRQFQHQEPEARRSAPRMRAGPCRPALPHADFGDDPVGAPEHPQMFDDVLACSRLVLLNNKPTTTPSAKADASDRHRAIRDQPCDMFFLLLKGFAEIIQCRLDLIGERLGPAFRAVENAFRRRVQHARDIPLNACNSSHQRARSNMALTLAFQANRMLCEPATCHLTCVNCPNLRLLRLRQVNQARCGRA